MKANVFRLGLSDHETAQTIAFAVKQIKVRSHFFVKKRDYNKENLKKFKQSITSIKFREVFDIDNVDTAFNEMHDVLKMFINLCFPEVFVKIYNKPNMRWLTKGIKLCCRRKREMYLKLVSSKSNKTENHTKYLDYTKTLKRCIKKAQITVNNNTISNSNNKGKAIWNIINSITGNIKEKQEINSINNNGIINSPTDIANLFNEYYIDLTKSNKFNQSINDPTTITNNINSIFLKPTDEEEVFKTIMKLKNSVCRIR